MPRPRIDHHTEGDPDWRAKEIPSRKHVINEIRDFYSRSYNRTHRCKYCRHFRHTIPDISAHLRVSHLEEQFREIKNVPPVLDWENISEEEIKEHMSKRDFYEREIK